MRFISLRSGRITESIRSRWKNPFDARILGRSVAAPGQAVFGRLPALLCVPSARSPTKATTLPRGLPAYSWTAQRHIARYEADVMFLQLMGWRPPSPHGTTAKPEARYGEARYIWPYRTGDGNASHGLTPYSILAFSSKLSRPISSA